MNLNNLIDVAISSGGTLFIMAGLLLLALAVMIERAWFLYRVMAGGREVNQRVFEVPPGRRDLLERETGLAGALPHAGLLKVALAHSQGAERQALSDSLEEVILHEVPRLDRALWVLDTAVTLAPLLGLFGTIIGMFNAFAGLGSGGEVASEVTGGVAEALIATACGLFIAMLGLVFLNGLNNRVRLLVHQLETLKQMLINRVAIAPAAPELHRTGAAPVPMARTGS